ncbi:MAG: agmatinase [Candidatus Gastranaerophilales bacterium]|nr:agmatinase [Candidatus Gastranaerophilales bacterium]
MPKNWIGASEDFKSSKWVLVGMPYDGTCSNRPGTRFGPETVRLASWGLEDYSPLQNKEINDVVFFDAGELEFPFGNRDKTLSIIKRAAAETLSLGKFWFGVGGEHLVTYPVIEAYLEKFPDIAIVHFDAHADLREEYLGETLSHATVMRRIVDKIGAERIIQIGIRSGTKEEFQWMETNKTLLDDKSRIQEALKKLAGRPVFISVDLDVLDPSIMSGTGTPEAGGMTFNEFMSWLLEFKGQNIVGADVVELSPHYDQSGASTALAAKVIREMLIFFS